MTAISLNGQPYNQLWLPLDKVPLRATTTLHFPCNPRNPRRPNSRPRPPSAPTPIRHNPAPAPKKQAAVPDRKTFGLTPREMEVVGCIVEGCSNRDIAKQFGLSEETVKRHLSNIFDKTGVSTRLELAMFAIAHHLVQTEH